MPFSELIMMAKGKVDTTQQKTSKLSTDHSYGGDYDCSELVWDNGQITMQSHSNRAKRGPFSNNFPSFIFKPQDGKDAKNSKTKFSTMDSVLNDFPLSDPSYEMEFDQDDNVVPWLSCSAVEPVNNVYCSDILPESFEAIENEFSADYSLASMEKGNNSNNVTEFTNSSPAANALSFQQGSTVKILSGATGANRFRNSEASSLIQSHHTVPRSENSELNHSDAGNGSHTEFRNSIRCSSPMSDSTGMKLHRLDAGQPNNASGLMNFSYFSRFASLSGVNTRKTDTNAGADPSSIQRIGSENKESALSSHNHVESTLMNSGVGFSHQESGSQAQPSPSNGFIESGTPKPDSVPPQQPVAIWREPDGKSDKSSDQPMVLEPTKLAVGGEKIPDPAVATSSICSGNILERASKDPAYNLKRKSCETGDSEGPSDDVDDESVGVHRTAGRTGSKRSRAAEVHNLSERRRRDRINEKMRALQELIPNCNKADKASMLDEAIEYLKTLQLQLQILSMGTGMCMPPMMLPAAMQHMYRAHMPMFSPIGLGMGSAVGYGMSMPNLNNRMMQMSSVQGPYHPALGPPVSNFSSFHGAASSIHQGLGHLGQGLSLSTPHAPLPLLGGLPMRLPMGNVSGMPGIADVLHLATSASQKDVMQNVSSQATLNDVANSSVNQGSNQATVLRNDQSQAAYAGEAQHHRDGSNTRPS